LLSFAYVYFLESSLSNELHPIKIKKIFLTLPARVAVAVVGFEGPKSLASGSAAAERGNGSANANCYLIFLFLSSLFMALIAFVAARPTRVGLRGSMVMAGLVPAIPGRAGSMTSPMSFCNEGFQKQSFPVQPFFRVSAPQTR
jgi:hypothetical protein